MGPMDQLVILSRSRIVTVSVSACRTLTHMTFNIPDDKKQKLMVAKNLRHLMAFLATTDRPANQKSISHLVMYLAFNEKNRKLLGEYGAISPLVNLMTFAPHERVRKAAERALDRLQLNHTENKLEVKRLVKIATAQKKRQDRERERGMSDEEETPLETVSGLGRTTTGTSTVSSTGNKSSPSSIARTNTATTIARTNTSKSDASSKGSPFRAVKNLKSAFTRKSTNTTDIQVTDVDGDEGRASISNKKSNKKKVTVSVSPATSLKAESDGTKLSVSPATSNKSASPGNTDRSPTTSTLKKSPSKTNKSPSTSTLKKSTSTTNKTADPPKPKRKPSAATLDTTKDSTGSKPKPARSASKGSGLTGATAKPTPKKK
eukprot:GFYU01007820.1.p1 GENE.GFYU01007820.1~~GFYU01007820.1.p1  ORF type:complete len:395 (+),score=103.99 GFYU01007820.1:63-1187(+)